MSKNNLIAERNFFSVPESNEISVRLYQPTFISELNWKMDLEIVATPETLAFFDDRGSYTVTATDSIQVLLHGIELISILLSKSRLSWTQFLIPGGAPDSNLPVMVQPGAPKAFREEIAAYRDALMEEWTASGKWTAAIRSEHSGLMPRR